jgi:hypothetical protein
MKKILLMAGVICLGLSSCKKDYICECTATVSGTGIPTTSSSTSTTIKDKKADAKTTCENGSKASVTVSGITSETKCVIK